MSLSLDLGLMCDNKKYRLGKPRRGLHQGRRPVPSAAAVCVRGGAGVEELHQRQGRQAAGEAAVRGRFRGAVWQGDRAGLCEPWLGRRGGGGRTSSQAGERRGSRGSISTATRLATRAARRWPPAIKEGAVPRLETLFFWGNKISGKGCKALATALMKGGCLLRICLFRHGNRPSRYAPSLIRIQRWRTSVLRRIKVKHAV